MLLDDGGVWFVNHSVSPSVSLLFLFLLRRHVFLCGSSQSLRFFDCDIFAIFALRARNFCSSGVGRSRLQVLQVGDNCDWPRSSDVWG